MQNSMAVITVLFKGMMMVVRRAGNWDVQKGRGTTTSGLMQMLERTYGIDFTKACELVAANNLEKYIPEGYTDSREIVERTLQMYEDTGQPVQAVLDKDSGCYYFVDANGKVRKPFGFTPVNLAECIPTRH